MNLLRNTDRGLYCAAGDFYIDPCRAVDFAVITHAHTDHARPGSRHYLASPACVPLLRQRLYASSHIESLPYGQTVVRNGVKLSLHPAGHILGSAQVRVEYQGEVWVASGDYKTEPDRTCETFEVVPCHTFITESTFALPIYRWRPQQEIFAEINAWWAENQREGRTGVLYAYSLGKAQRLLAGLDHTLGPILVHPTVHTFAAIYQAEGYAMPSVQSLTPELCARHRGRALIVIPPTAKDNIWLSQCGDISPAFASGWMQVHGTRRQRVVDAGFVLSDHADWPGILQTVSATGAERVGAYHGYIPILERYFAEQGYDIVSLDTWPCPDREDDPENEERLSAAG